MNSLRHKVLAALGRFPAKVPLKPRVENEEKADGFSRLLVTYQLEKDERGIAYLLVPGDAKPRGRRKYPAVVAIHQHAGQFYLGKSEPAGLSANSMYHYGLHL